MNYWIISPFDSTENYFTNMWNYDLENNVVSIGWSKIGDPSRFKEINLLVDELKKVYPEGKRPYNKMASMIWDFYHNIEPNDILLARKGLSKLIGIGIVKSRAYYDREEGIKATNNSNEYYPNFIKVDWSEIDLDLESNVLRYTLEKIDEDTYTSYTNQLAFIGNKNTWVHEIVKAFEKLGGGVIDSKDLYDYIEQNTKRELAENWRQNINKIIRIHSSDSNDNQYTGKDYFEKIGELGDGCWALRDNANQLEPTPDSEDYSKEWKEENIFRVVRDTKRAKELKLYYNNKCQICGSTIKLKKMNYSEVHHIKPLGKKHNGPDKLSNMIVLCPNHHVEFDYGVIALDPEKLKVIHKNRKNPYYDKEIKIKEKHKLEKEYLEYHLKEIFQ
ncbi:MAG: HNH endonuclease [Candidatus Heimdallarchaeota archaeon]|nr:HNH endonuclease [Candidatus Heimdallarchaeota archaeon]